MTNQESAVEKLPKVMLNICLFADDRYVELEREAPQLPIGISWHKGMIYLEPMGDGHGCIVSEVAFNDNHLFLVVIEAMQVCPSKIDGDLKQMQENGWRLAR